MTISSLEAIQTELLRIESLRRFLLERHRDALDTYDPGTRLLILVATLLKLRKQARACLLLSQEFMVEEVTSIVRTMVEITVNAAYLQFAGDEEIDRFHHFEAQSLYKHSERLKPLTTRILTDHEESEIRTAVEGARQLTQLNDKASSWSKPHATLISRAELVDSKMVNSTMPALVLSVYNWSHRAVHGTADALRPFYNALGQGEVPLTDKRLEELRDALSMVLFCLEVFAFFFDRLLHQDRQADILAATKITL